MERLKKLTCSYLKTKLYFTCLAINTLIIQFSYINYFDMQSQNKVNLLSGILDERKTDSALLISVWLLWYSLSDNSWKICWHFFPFCSPLWELEDKIASITTTTTSFRLSKQSLYLEHHASLALSHGLAENFDGSFVLIWAPRAKGGNVIATSLQRGDVRSKTVQETPTEHL